MRFLAVQYRDPIKVISSNQKDSQRRYKNNNSPNPHPKMCPVYKMCREKDRAEVDRMANKGLLQIKTHLMGKNQSTLLMIICYACRQQRSITIL